MSVTLRDFKPSKSSVVDEIKLKVDDLCSYLEQNVPDNRCRSIAITNLEQGAMWAVKANFTKDSK